MVTSDGDRKGRKSLVKLTIEGSNAILCTSHYYFSEKYALNTNHMSIHDVIPRVIWLIVIFFFRVRHLSVSAYTQQSCNNIIIIITTRYYQQRRPKTEC